MIEHKQHGKFIISIDSLGNLSSQKEMNDIESGKTAVDMGTPHMMLKSCWKFSTLPT